MQPWEDPFLSAGSAYPDIHLPLQFFFLNPTRKNSPSNE